MPRKRSLTAEQEEAVRGMAARGVTYREIAEHFGVSPTLISRVMVPPADRPPAFVGAPPPPRSRPKREPLALTLEPHPSAEIVEPSPEPDPPIIIPEDPRELVRADWLWYERQKVAIRRKAEAALAADNVRGFEIFSRQALIAEKRADELRPPIPPDPNKDPMYTVASAHLLAYIADQVAKAEVGAAIEPRALPPIEPVPLPKKTAA